MIKKLLLLVKKFILGILFIYAFNVIVFPIDVTIPINVFSIILVTVCGLPGVIGLCLFTIFIL